jgi:hypothetical protein
VREPTRASPQDVGQVEEQGNCQVCGAPGPVIAVLGASPPNTFCPRCAIEYGREAVEEEGIGD